MDNSRQQQWDDTQCVTNKIIPLKKLALHSIVLARHSTRKKRDSKSRRIEEVMDRIRQNRMNPYYSLYGHNGKDAVNYKSGTVNYKNGPGPRMKQVQYIRPQRWHETNSFCNNGTTDAYAVQHQGRRGSPLPNKPFYRNRTCTLTPSSNLALPTSLDF